MAGYLGASPVPQSILKKESKTLTANQTTVNTSGYTHGGSISVTLNGVLLEGAGVDYTATNGSDIVLTAGATAGDILHFQAFNEFTLVGQELTTPTINNATLKSNVTLKNDTHEDSDGGRASKIIYQGEQSGGEISTLAEIEAAHDGTADDQKGDLIFKTNDGNDGTSPSEVMRIDSLGNVGIGTNTIDVSTQAGGSGYKALQIESDEGGQLNFDHNDAGTGSTLGQINFQRAGEVLAEIEGVTDGATDNGRLAFRTQPNGGALTERMRLDHDGNFIVGDTEYPIMGTDTGTGSAMSANGQFRAVADGDVAGYFKRLSSNGTVMQFYRAQSAVGRIDVTTSATSYVTSSDYRLKENVETLSSGINRVKQLKPKRFSWIIDEEDNANVDGFLAHEVSTVVSEAITGAKDAVDKDGNIEPQGIDQSKLVPLLTAALQEAIAKIETLETKVTALEAE